MATPTSTTSGSSDEGGRLEFLPAGSGVEARRRRIAYFMLFRLAVLVVCTGLAAIVTWQRASAPEARVPWEFWGALGAGYGGAAWFAMRLAHTSRLGRIASGQTVFDVLLSTAVVQLSGGLLSGFSFLYLLTVLGAAVMGTRRLVVVAASACAVLYVGLGLAQTLGLWSPPGVPGEGIPTGVAVSEILRTTAALAGVGALSAYLNTQLVRSAEQAGSLRNLTERILRSLDSGLLTATREGRITYANPAARRILGRQDLVGQSLDALLPGHAGEGGRDRRTELDYTRPDGTTVRLGIAHTPLRGDRDDEIGTILHFQDVTELRRMEERLRRSEHMAALGRLTGAVAHEIRNPLAAISGSAQLLARTVNDDAGRRLVATIGREAERLDRLVADMLAYGVSKPPDTVPVDLAHAVREVTEMVQRDPMAEHTAVELTVAPELPRVDADPNQLSQVLWNLLRNAVEAAGDGGRVHVSVFRDGDDVAVTVRDDGPGFEGDPAQHLEPFVTTKPDGSGFGLAIARRIVEDHSGRIELANRPEGGAEVTVRFPASTVAEAPANVRR